MRIIFLISVFLITGCCFTASPWPVDKVIIKDCLDSGGNPEYFANGCKIEFKCIKKKETN
jgi:hypothetical protein